MRQILQSSAAMALLLALASFVNSCSSSATLAKDSDAKIKKETVAKIIKKAYAIPGTDVNYTMALLPAGTFSIGTPSDVPNRSADEGPQKNIRIESFWIGVHEVKFDEYKIYRKKNLDKAPADQPEWDVDAYARPSPPYEDPTFGMGENGYPAVSMTQLAALQYCKWLSEKTGDFYRLPTEAEWEYACKAGTGQSLYFENKDSLDRYAWHYDNSMEKYHKVGSKAANPWGLHDMIGNVSEWTLDEYTEDAYASFEDQAINPWIKPTSLHPRTVRGGSWDDGVKKHSCTCRIKSSFKWKERDPQIPKSFWWNTDSPFVGFRIVKPAVPPSPEEQQAFWDMVLGG